MSGTRAGSSDRAQHEYSVQEVRRLVRGAMRRQRCRVTTSTLTLPIGSMPEALHVARHTLRHARFIVATGAMLGAMPGMWTLPAQPRPPVVTQQQSRCAASW
jgi:hypothetical protein